MFAQLFPIDCFGHIGGRPVAVTQRRASDIARIVEMHHVLETSEKTVMSIRGSLRYVAQTHVLELAVFEEIQLVLTGP